MELTHASAAGQCGTEKDIDQDTKDITGYVAHMFDHIMQHRARCFLAQLRGLSISMSSQASLKELGLTYIGHSFTAFKLMRQACMCGMCTAL